MIIRKAGDTLLKTVMTIIASFWLMLVPAVVSGNTVQAQQGAAAVQSENKDAGTAVADTIQSDSKTAGTQTADIAQSGSKAAGTQAADIETAEAEKKYIHKVSIGIRLMERYWGMGIGAETLNMLVDYLYNETDIEIIAASSLPDNHGSAGILRKCGFDLVVHNGLEDWGFGEPQLTDKWIK